MGELHNLIHQKGSQSCNCLARKELNFQQLVYVYNACNQSQSAMVLFDIRVPGYG